MIDAPSPDSVRRAGHHGSARRVSLELAAAACVLASSACTSDAPPRRFHDDAAFIPNGRLRWQISGPTDEPISQRPRGFIELNATGTRGDDKGVDFELSEVAGSYVIQFNPKLRSRIELGAGLAYASTTLDDGLEEDNERRLGVRLQFSPSIALSSLLSVYGRLALTGLVAESSSDQIELGFAWRIDEIFSLNAGYRWWHYQSEDFSGATFDEVDVYSRGPVIGLAVEM
ncbi:MAG TPA: hypothetical protein VM509_14690 [Planctomycetota bacterium]|nr:hypothetical protein [Planctomycetota bacterium]